jgi:hypothetical protein
LDKKEEEEMNKVLLFGKRSEPNETESVQFLRKSLRLRSGHEFVDACEARERVLKLFGC